LIRVLIAEDSATLRDLMVNIVSAEPDMTVIATAVDGVQAVAAVRHLKPDVVTMDIHMPRMDGFEATRRIMEAHPVPIVIVSGAVIDQMSATFRAVEAGALAFVPRPAVVGGSNGQVAGEELLRTVRLMAEIKVVRRWKKSGGDGRTMSRGGLARPLGAPARPSGATGKGVAPIAAPGRLKLIVIGASTGGPMALRAILSGLNRDFPVPVLVVQHISPGFLQSFAEWLDEATGMTVRIAADGEYPAPGHVYLAPDGAHMGVAASGAIFLDPAPTETGLQPSVSYLFRSAADSAGAETVGILLSGMGADGAAELKRLRDVGAVTIAQSMESSIIHGMPGVAIGLGGATHILDPGEIAPLLLQLVEA
jgi:two-component system chemotaxis response regulator CheB